MGEHTFVTVDTVSCGVEQLTGKFTWRLSQGDPQKTHYYSCKEEKKLNASITELSILYPLLETKQEFLCSEGYHACTDSGQLEHRIL